MSLAAQTNNAYLLGYSNKAISEFYEDLDDFQKALFYLFEAEKVLDKNQNGNQLNLDLLFWTRQSISRVYAKTKNETRAKYFIDKYTQQANIFHMPEYYRLHHLYQNISMQLLIGNYVKAQLLFSNPEVKRLVTARHFLHWYYAEKAFVFQKNHHFDSADYYYKIAFANQDTSRVLIVTELYYNYAGLLTEEGKLADAIKYFELARIKSEQYKNLDLLLSIYQSLDMIYFKAGNIYQAYQYNKLSQKYEDSLNQISKIKDLALLEIEDEQKQLEQNRIIQQERINHNNKLRTFIFSGAIIIVLIIAGMLYNNNRHKQKANIVLQQQKTKTEIALSELKSTQAQLIQSEKMASLGELTAGIAHEIQNPLNFVNNFSELNQEMVDELQTELKAGNSEEAIAISNDIKDNSEKINHHGKRADAIVKNMLQHSRTSTGHKEPTDINALCDEYLRLSYHVFRAKDKSFNAETKTDFDESIGKINIVPQDIGRVLLNLYNNAFYAVTEKKKQQPAGYEPTVSVVTKKKDHTIELTVKDNGNGIPQKVIDKIFQPFFTTKPTGEGTGLGLSLSYDIIKAHGGEIKVETKEGEGSVFTMTLTLV